MGHGEGRGTSKDERLGARNKLGTREEAKDAVVRSLETGDIAYLLAYLLT